MKDNNNQEEKRTHKLSEDGKTWKVVTVVMAVVIIVSGRLPLLHTYVYGMAGMIYGWHVQCFIHV